MKSCSSSHSSARLIKDSNLRFRIGQGIDVHRLVPGRKLVLGGVEIEYEYGLEGHSDADVILHAVMDSLLGAAALPDIGVHFPDTDPAWQGANSLELLKIVWGLVVEHGWSLANLDITVLLEKPKIAPYIDLMVANISEVLQCSRASCRIKATTCEGLGFVGRQEGIEAHSVVLLVAA